MTDQSQSGTGSRGGDRRGPDRRANDRRRNDRRTPPPVWRRPWAFAAYGVLATLVLVLLLRGGGEEDTTPETGEVFSTVAPPATDPAALPASQAPPIDAYSVGDYERLLAEGESVVGQRVRTELFCSSMDQITLRDVERVNRSVAALADANRRVPAAECRWGAEASAPDFILLVPPGLAQRFAAAPEVEQGFVRRRRVRVELEWVGRSDALALRNVGVLTSVNGDG